MNNVCQTKSYLVVSDLKNNSNVIFFTKHELLYHETVSSYVGLYMTIVQMI